MYNSKPTQRSLIIALLLFSSVLLPHVPIIEAQEASSPAACFDNTGASIDCSTPTLDIISSLNGSIGDTTATFSWETGRDTNYVFEWGLSSSSYTNRLESIASSKTHSLTLANLVPETIYYYRISIKDTQGKANQIPDRVFKTNIASTGENTTITDIEVHINSPRKATIKWKTNHPGTSEVVYGLMSEFVQQVGNTDKTVDHTAVLNDLQPGTIYYFEVVSVGNTTSFIAFLKFKMPDFVQAPRTSTSRTIREGSGGGSIFSIFIGRLLDLFRGGTAPLSSPQPQEENQSTTTRVAPTKPPVVIVLPFGGNIIMEYGRIVVNTAEKVIDFVRLMLRGISLVLEPSLVSVNELLNKASSGIISLLPDSIAGALDGRFENVRRNGGIQIVISLVVPIMLIFVIGWSFIGLFRLLTSVPEFLTSLFMMYVFPQFTNTSLLRKGERSWGVVYDAITKRPLGGAVVTTRGAHKGMESFTQSAVSDHYGRFGFVMSKGSFVISVRRYDYTFPSELVSGRTDGVYEALYHGDTVDIKSSNVLVNIPLDPLGFDRQKLEEPPTYDPVFSQFRRQGMRVVIVLGITIALFVYILYPITDNLLIILLYFMGLISRRFGERKDLWGAVYRKSDKHVLQLVGVRAVGTKDQKTADYTLTDDRGRFRLLLPRGEYSVQLEKLGVVPEVISKLPLLTITKPRKFVNFDIGV